MEERLIYLSRLCDAYEFVNECEAETQWATEKKALLDQLTIPDDIDELALAKTRFDGIERDVQKRSSQLDSINEKASNLNQCDAQAELINLTIADVNNSWSNLRAKLNNKRDEFIHGEAKQKFVLDVNETELWIEEKITIIDTTRDYGDTLSGVLALQRKLGTMQRDVHAIESKIEKLKNDAEKINQQYPQDEEMTDAKLDVIDHKFTKLRDSLKLREEKLGQAGHMQTFMRDLAEYQVCVFV